jgi:O-antigen ligase
MDDIKNENNFLLKTLRILLIGVPFLFTLIYIPGFVFPGSFPRSIFLYVAVSVTLILWLLHSFKEGRLVVQKNWLTATILGYLGILFISGLIGGHFEYAFFGSFGRMTGIVTMLYISLWYLLASSVLQKRDWIYLLRLLLLSGFILAIISFLNLNGFNIEFFSFLTQGGSLFANNTFSGIYYLFVFFFGIILFFQEKSWKWRIAYVSAMFIILINPDIFNFQILQNLGMIKDVFHNPTLVLGTARASSITMGVGIIITVVMYVIHRTRRISINTKSILFGLMLLCMLLVAVGFVWSAVSQKGAGYEFLTSQNDFPRPIAWGQSIEAFKNKPLFGYGPNGFQYAFQDTLTSDIPLLKGGKWFDKVHNGFLEPLVETGVVGTIGMFAIFLAACWYSYTYYRRTSDFSAVVVMLLLVLHMIQIQTSFNINTSFFMIYVLLAYVASYEPSRVSYVLSRPTKTLLLSLGSAIILVFMVFTAIIPARYGYSIPNAMASGNFNKRMNLYKSLQSLYGYPADMVFTTAETFTNALIENLEPFNNDRARAGIVIEYNALLDLYESHYEQYNDNFRYMNNYVLMIFIARLFGVDRLDRAGELIINAKELSTAVPQIFWLAALHAKYTGNEKLAFEEADKAIELCELNIAKFDESQLGSFCSISSQLRTFLEVTQGSKKKVFFHLQEI